MDFNYEKFETDLLNAVEEYAKAKLQKKDDLYIISIDYWPEFTTSIALRANTYSYLKEQAEPSEKDYTYYKYCEEEWDWDMFAMLEELSRDLRVHYKNLEDACDDEKYEEYDAAQREHSAKIIEVCKKVMKSFRQTDTYKAYSDLALNVYVREHFEKEECIEIFEGINGPDKIEEYAGWL